MGKETIWTELVDDFELYKEDGHYFLRGPNSHARLLIKDELEELALGLNKELGIKTVEEGEPKWADSIDAESNLFKASHRTLAFRTTDGDTELLLNRDLPALIGAMMQHLDDIGEDELVKQAGSEVVGILTPEELGEVLLELTEGANEAWVTVIAGILHEELSVPKTLALMEVIRYAVTH